MEEQASSAAKVSSRGKKDRGSSRSSKAGLAISVARVETELRKNVTTKRVSELASVALAGVVEYVIKEILSLAKAEMVANKRKRIMRRDLGAVGDDAELSNLIPASSLGGIAKRKAASGEGEEPKKKKKKLKKKKSGSKKRKPSAVSRKRKREESEESEGYSSASSSSSSASPKKKKKTRRTVRKSGKSPRKKK